MCLLESLWIFFRQRIRNYPRQRRDDEEKEHNSSLLEKLQESLFLVFPPKDALADGGGKPRDQDTDVQVGNQEKVATDGQIGDQEKLAAYRQIRDQEKVRDQEKLSAYRQIGDQDKIATNGKVGDQEKFAARGRVGDQEKVVMDGNLLSLKAADVGNASLSPDESPTGDIWDISQGFFVEEQSHIGLEEERRRPTFFQHQIGPYNYYTVVSIPTPPAAPAQHKRALREPSHPVVRITDEQALDGFELYNAVNDNILDLCSPIESGTQTANVTQHSRAVSSCEETESGVLCGSSLSDTAVVDSSGSDTDTDGESSDYDADDYFNIQELPLEIIHYIFSFMTLPQICQYVAPVCRRWRHLATDPMHWQRLDIGPNISSSHMRSCILRAPMLRTLCLHWRTDLTLAEVTLFAVSCPQLQDLNLSYCENINNTVLAVICKHCPNLISINLEGCRMVDTSCIEHIVRLTKVRAVFLSHCASITTAGIEQLSRTLRHLEKLNIDGIPDITDSAIKMIVECHGNHLRMLCVDGAALSDAAFGTLSECRLLTTLCVSFGELLTDYSLEYIQHVNTLRTLRLCKCGGFTLEGLVNLFSLKTFTTLVHLDLSDCINLHDGGIHSIVNCCGHSLRQLYLCWCWYITDTGLQDIVVNCVNMEVLDLMGLCDIGGNCLVLLPTTMPKLRQLDLSQCHQVTDELLVDVVAKLPNLVVFNYYGEKIQYCPETGLRKHRLHRCTVTN